MTGPEDAATLEGSEEGGISVPQIVAQAGLEELCDMGMDELRRDFVTAATTGLADGDIFVIHPPYTGRDAEMYGELSYNQGRVAKAILKLAIENGMEPGPIEEFQNFAAEIFTNQDSPFQKYGANAKSSVSIHTGAVLIDGNPLVLPRKPDIVLDYGACLTGRSYLDDQIRMLHEGQRPFAYCPLTRLPFMNRSLIKTYDAKFGATLGRNVATTFIDKQLYIGREDGVASATDEIIKGQISTNTPVDVADIILTLGAHHSSAEDLKKGMTNAFTLLKEGGMLVIRSFARPAAGELGTDEITGWAYEAGFLEKDALRYDANLHQLGTLLATGHFGDRMIKTMVLTK